MNNKTILPLVKVSKIIKLKNNFKLQTYKKLISPYQQQI